MRRKYRFPRATLAFGLKLERAWLEWAAELQSELASSD
jgi:hypothetical protein